LKKLGIFLIKKDLCFGWREKAEQRFGNCPKRSFEDFDGDWNEIGLNLTEFF